MAVDEVVAQLLNDPAFAANVAAYRELPSRDARWDDWPRRVDPRLVSAFAARGIERPFSHQAAAIDAALSGDNVAVVTPTASGKTLCYNVPVLNALLQDDTARALYLFPTKALSQDQVHELEAVVNTLGVEVRSYTYDGDTPQTARRALRSAGHIIVTNPDMLHSGILPHHTRWIRLFENLRYIVIDELHTYRGIFGSHVANVIRRLKRICRYYGSDPTFICCSATIANPRELAERLIEEPVRLVDDNGAPSGRKHILLYNPPLVNRQLGIRASSRHAAASIAARFLRENVQTIVFTRSRTGVEILLQYLREAAGRRRDAVRGYRSGYLPLQRREIERGLRDGAVRAVVATNALELGIDIGALDACVVAGFPGTIASAWQQMGRAGRRNESAVAVMVATGGPLDQFLASHPDFFFGRSPEAGLIDPNNLIILISHVKCAAFELPFRDGERFGVDWSDDILAFLEESGMLHHANNVWHWMSESFPAQEVSLRTATADNVVIVDQGPPARVIGEIDRASAPTMLHEEAIYIHEGQQYQVERLDLAEKKAFVRAVDVDYYTDAELAVQIKVLEEFESAGARSHGEVAVTYRPTIYKKIKFNTHENVGWGTIHLDEDTFHSTAYWITVPERSLSFMNQAGIEAGLQGVAHVLGQVAPLFLMCDPHDIAVWPEVKSVHTAAPTIFLYDRVPGGVGFARRLYRVHQRVLGSALDIIAGCTCEFGCPACIGPHYDGTVNPKHAAMNLVAILQSELSLPGRAP